MDPAHAPKTPWSGLGVCHLQAQGSESNQTLLAHWSRDIPRMAPTHLASIRSRVESDRIPSANRGRSPLGTANPYPGRGRHELVRYRPRGRFKSNRDRRELIDQRSSARMLGSFVLLDMIRFISVMGSSYSTCDPFGGRETLGWDLSLRKCRKEMCTRVFASMRMQS